jgi:hypothetical protein
METYIIVNRKSFETESPAFSSVKEAVAWANQNLFYDWNKFSQIAIVEEMLSRGLKVAYNG